MKFYHRHSFFPFVLAVLTLALVVFMFYAFTDTPLGSSQPEQVLNPVSDEQYQKELRLLTTEFIDSYQKATDPSSRNVLVDQALSSLLALRVPSQNKELHLDLAIDLSQLRQDESTFPRFVDRVSSQDWLK